MGVVENIARIRAELDANSRERVEILAVTKFHSAEEINLLADTEVRQIGENRVQEWLEKRGALNSVFSTHIIGQLQRNKVKYTVGCVSVIQSVDRLELALDIDARAQKLGVVQDVLLEVNIAREPQKGGVLEEDFQGLLDSVGRLECVRIRGLMCMMPLTGDVEGLRPYFRRMRTLFERVRDDAPSNVDMNILSMGMTQDYVIAAQEGSNMVRLGHAVFQ